MNLAWPLGGGAASSNGDSEEEKSAQCICKMKFWLVSVQMCLVS